ncbi:MAG: GNAT family N-acetyltransferase [Prevotellaceae bacterium]|jgi:GNAT superfamily N-acetyltransferase|nr:GNAT family N-acetyltransferase [Prevotellaceae bacterium]
MITYRKATLHDAEKLAKIRSIFLREASNVFSESEKNSVEQANFEYFKKALCDNSFVAWLALDGEEIVATSGVSFSAEPPSFKVPNGKVAYIMNMYTFPTHRKRGIATELFTKIVEEAKLLGCKKITLSATDMGRPLYEKYGFKDAHNNMVYLCQV